MISKTIISTDAKFIPDEVFLRNQDSFILPSV